MRGIGLVAGEWMFDISTENTMVYGFSEKLKPRDRMYKIGQIFSANQSWTSD
jgi:hypothetical protein